MFRKSLVLLLTLVLTSFIVKSAFADRRSYVWTYEYLTMVKGEVELEFYNTVEWKDKSDSKTNTWKPWLEIEYGITDNWDISLYQQFKQTNSSKSADVKFEYDGMKIRTRYKIGEKGSFFVDPLLYFEWKRNDDFTVPNTLETKLILGKDFDRLNLSFNYILDDIELASHAKPAAHKYASGISYEFDPSFKLGFEFNGSFSAEKHYFGPSISFAGSKIWTTIGTAYGLNNKSDYVQVRTLLGIFF